PPLSTLSLHDALPISRYIVPLHEIQNSRGRSSGSLCGADQGFDHGFEDDEAVSGIERRLDGALGMRHEAGHVAFTIADAGDVVRSEEHTSELQSPCNL